MTSPVPRLTTSRAAGYHQQTFAKEDSSVVRAGKGNVQGGRFFFFYYFPGVRPRTPLS